MVMQDRYKQTIKELTGGFGAVEITQPELLGPGD